MNRDDPAEGFALIERIGADEYNRLLREHRRASIVATINGHEIWPVQTRFGRLYVVGGTERAFSMLAEAEACAREKTADPLRRVFRPSRDNVEASLPPHRQQDDDQNP